MAKSSRVVDTFSSHFTDYLISAAFMHHFLGEDSDTTASATGGLAGLLYGVCNIPKVWLNQLARENDIEELALRMRKKIA